MRKLLGWPAKGCWTPLRLSKVILKGWVKEQGIGHEPTLELTPKPTVKATVEAILGVEAGVTAELVARVALGAALWVDNQGPPMDLCLRGGWHLENLRWGWKESVEDYSLEPSVSDVEIWLEWQAWQLGTPAWWSELKAIPGVEDPRELTCKIWASFYIPEVKMRAFLEQEYTVPSASKCLNRNTFLLDELSYKDTMATTDSPNDCLLKRPAILGWKNLICQEVWTFTLWQEVLWR